jgi:5-methylthioadenosine/S-adenosylhomocysteine deaminase
MKYLIQNSTLIPMVKDHESLAQDLLIENGIIKKIGKIEPDNNTTIIDAKDCFTLPGFIQGHIHLVQTLLRHQADDLELLDWLKDRTWPFEAAIDGDDVEASSTLGAAELLLGGTTTICDYGTTHSHERVFKVIEKMGMRYIGGKTQMDQGQGEGVPAPILETTESSLREVHDLGKKWHLSCNGRIQYAVTPRFAVSCTENLLKESVKLARENGWYLQTHASENKSEIALVEKSTGKKNIEYLHDLGFSGQDTILAHCVHVSENEMNLLEKTKTRVCHCPGSNLKLASGIADIPEMLRRKIPVMLGADGAPCNNRLSIFNEMNLAALIHKVKYGPKSMPAWQVLKMATIDAAKALRLDRDIGTLEVGKKADIVILSRKSLSMNPAGDAASQIVYGANSNDVDYVFVDGKMLVEKSNLKSIKKEVVIAQSREAWVHTRSRMKDFKS